MSVSVQNLYKQVISEEISVEKFMYTVRRDNVLSKYINNIMLFEDVVNVFKNKGFIWETEDKKEDESFNFIKSFSIIQESNKLKGGKGDKLTVDQVNFYEFTKGWKHEMEHTDDVDKAKEIALDHLAEDPMYYTRLEMMELQANKKKRTDLPKEYSKKDMVDKDNATKPVKGFKKYVKDSTKRIDNKASKKPVGVKQLKGGPGELVSKPLNEAANITELIQQLITLAASGAAAGIFLKAAGAFDNNDRLTFEKKLMQTYIDKKQYGKAYDVMAYSPLSDELEKHFEKDPNFNKVIEDGHKKNYVHSVPKKEKLDETYNSKHQFFVIKKYNDKYKIYDGYVKKQDASTFLHDNPSMGFVVKTKVEVNNMGLNPGDKKNWDKKTLDKANEAAKPKTSTNKEPIPPLSLSDIKFLVIKDNIVLWMGKDEKVADKKASELSAKKYTPNDSQKLNITYDSNVDYTSMPIHALYLMLFGKIKNYNEFDKIKAEVLKAKGASGITKRDIKHNISKEDEKFDKYKSIDAKFAELKANREKFNREKGLNEETSTGKWEGPGIYSITNKINNKTVNVEIKTEIVFDRVLNNPSNSSVKKVANKEEQEKDTNLFIWRRKQDNNDSWGELTQDEYDTYKNDKDIQFIKPTTQKELEKRDADKAKPNIYSSNAKSETKEVLINKPNKSSDVKFMTSDEIEKYKKKYGEDSITIKNVSTDKRKVVTGGSKEVKDNDLNKNFNNVPEVDRLGIKKGVKLNPRDLASQSKWALFDPKEDKVIKFYGLGGRPEAEDDLSKNMGKGYLILPSLHPRVKKSLMEGELKKKDKLAKYKGLELSFSISKLNKLVRISGLYLKDIEESKDKKYDFQIKLNDIDETTSQIKDGGSLFIKQSTNKNNISIYSDSGNFYKVLDVDRNLDSLIKSLYKDKEEDTTSSINEFINTPVKSGPVVRLKELQREFRNLDKNDINSREPGTRQRANERLDKIKDLISKISFDESQLNDKQVEEFNKIRSYLKDFLNEDNSKEEYKELIKMKPSDLSDYVSKNIDSWKKQPKKIELSKILLSKYSDKDPANLKIKDALQKIK